MRHCDYLASPLQCQSQVPISHGRLSDLTNLDLVVSLIFVLSLNLGGLIGRPDWPVRFGSSDSDHNEICFYVMYGFCVVSRKFVVKMYSPIFVLFVVPSM